MRLHGTTDITYFVHSYNLEQQNMVYFQNKGRDKYDKFFYF